MAITVEDIDAMRARLRARQEQRRFDLDSREALRIVSSRHEVIDAEYEPVEEVPQAVAVAEDDYHVRLQRAGAWLAMLMAGGTALIVLDYIRSLYR